MTLIAIGCYNRVGKDTAADALVRDLGYKKVAFAKPLKDLALQANPIVLPQAATVNVAIDHNRLRNIVIRDGWESAKDRYPAVRRFLEDLGNGARDVFGAEFWVDQALARVSGNTVISDLRFRNEAEAVKAAGGYVIRIDRPGHAGRDFEKDLDSFDDWDLIVANNASIVELEQTVVGFAKAVDKRASSLEVS